MKPFEAEIWRVLEDGDLYTPNEIADEACIPRSAVVSVMARIADPRIAEVEHYLIPDDVTLLRRADVKSTPRDVTRKLASIVRAKKKSRTRMWRPKVIPVTPPGVEIQDFMIRFCRKVPDTI